MADVKTLIDTLNTITPLGIIAALSYVIYLLVKQRRTTSKQYTTLTSNHLHELPDIVDALRRIEQGQAATAAALLGQLADIRESLAYLKARLNGKS